MLCCILVLLALPVYCIIIFITLPPRQHHFHYLLISAKATTRKIWFNTTMAGRFFGSSSASIDMIVTNTPSQELALTNFAFISASDLPKFAVPGHDNLYLASIGDSFVFSISYPSFTTLFASFHYTFLFIFYIIHVVRFISLDLKFPLYNLIHYNAER